MTPFRRGVASAPGKINVYLAVGSPQADGYHPLTSIFQAISLREWVEVKRPPEGSSGGQVVRTFGYRPSPSSGLPTFDEAFTRQLAALNGADHLALRAARAVLEHAAADERAADSPLEIAVHKTVPVAGGMAGGSADAAAALVATNEMLGSPLSFGELEEVGATLGADVPACLVGGLALGLGRGDLMTPLLEGTWEADADSWWWVACLSDGGLSTPSVFKEFDGMGRSDRVRAGGAVSEESVPGRSVNPEVLEAVRSGVSRGIQVLRNDLGAPAFALRPELKQVEARMLEAGCREVLLSGSGPTLVGAVQDETDAKRVAKVMAGEKHVRGAYPIWGASVGARVERHLPHWCETAD